jgi:hypothetical protein
VTAWRAGALGLNQVRQVAGQRFQESRKTTVPKTASRIAAR